MYTIQWNSFWKQRPKVGAIFSSDASTLSAQPAIPYPATDISLQEKYEYLAEYGTHILCMLNRDTGCTYLSRNFDSITGLRGQDYYGHSILRLIHSDYHESFEKLLGDVIPEHKPLQWRCKLQHADKKWYWYNFMIHSRHGEKKGEFVCILDNINEDIQARNTLQKAKLEAELALRSRSEFLSNMSHELRTPLNAIIGFSQVIESEILGKIDHPQYQEYIRHIHESGYDLLAKIEDLLEIANIDAGRVTLIREDVSVAEIFRHVVDTQTHHALSAQVVLEAYSTPAEIPLEVDRLKLQHILGHLVSNAIKFSPQGTTIRLDAALNTQGVQIIVRDTGTGMTGVKLDAIVQAMQEDNCWSAAQDSQSIGLGLALTREFVALHGGAVTINSKPADGTTVVIMLPNDCVRQPLPQEADEFAA